MIAHPLSKLSSGFDSAKEAEIYLDIANRFEESASRNEAYVKITQGDYAGSIAKVTDLVCLKNLNGYKKSVSTTRWNPNKFQINVSYGSFKVVWDGRKNKISPYTHMVEWLEDYTGPTVFCLIDKKAIAAEMLTRDQLDTRGNVLAIGDEVIYINARYGDGMCLCEGTIVGFKAEKVTESRAHVSVIIQNDNVPTEESKISKSENMIMKKTSV